MIDRHSESLCLDGGRCYSVTKSGDTRDRSPVRLRYKRKMLIIQNDPEKELQPEKTFALQVLYGQVRIMCLKLIISIQYLGHD